MLRNQSIKKYRELGGILAKGKKAAKKTAKKAAKKEPVKKEEKDKAVKFKSGDPLSKRIR